MTETKVWLITGCSSGIGRALVRSALQAGDRVAATARKPQDLADLAEFSADRLLTARLDLEDEASIQAAVAQARSAFGAVDVLVNNAGVGMVGTVEECTADEVARTFRVNVFGTLAVIRAVLPHMRARRRGRVVVITSMGGLLASPTVGVYNATKQALEGLMEAMRGEVAHLGITTHLVEPGLIRTDFRERGIFRPTHTIADYDVVREPMVRNLASPYPDTATAPEVVAEAMVALMNQPQPAFRLPVGLGALPRVDEKIAELQAATAAAAALGLG